MDLKQIESLVKILEDSSLTEMTIQEGNLKIKMSKLDKGTTFVTAPNIPSSTLAAEKTEVEEVEDEKTYINSPIVGTFYSAAAPDVPAYVKVGDHVKNGQTICILEAMKLMTEIQAEFDCEIEAVLVSNAQKVEYGQPLFRVKKL